MVENQNPCQPVPANLWLGWRVIRVIWEIRDSDIKKIVTLGYKKGYTWLHLTYSILNN